MLILVEYCVWNRIGYIFFFVKKWRVNHNYTFSYYIVLLIKERFVWFLKIPPAFSFLNTFTPQRGLLHLKTHVSRALMWSHMLPYQEKKKTKTPIYILSYDRYMFDSGQYSSRTSFRWMKSVLLYVFFTDGICTDYIVIWIFFI